MRIKTKVYYWSKFRPTKYLFIPQHMQNENVPTINHYVLYFILVD